jgi:hypothetical protein
MRGHPARGGRDCADGGRRDRRRNVVLGFCAALRDRDGCRDGLGLFLDKKTVARKLAADVAFGYRFYRALAISLADRMRKTVRRTGGGAPDLDPQTVAKDELDSRMLGVVSMTRDRFDRLLKMLVGEP